MLIPTDSEILSWVATAVISECARENPHLPKIESFRQNPSSTTWVVRAIDGGIVRRFFIKRHGEEKMYEREKNILLLLRPHSSNDEHYAVPQMLAWNDKQRLVAISWLDGEPVGCKLRSAARRIGRGKDLKEGRELAYEVGRWLHHFEKRTSTKQNRSFPSEAISGRIRELNKLIQSSGLRNFDVHLSSAIEANVAQNLSLINSGYEFSSTHRDFSFQHVWKRTNGIVVIDFGRCVKGPRGRDAAQFYLRLGDLSAFNPMVSSRKVHQLQTAFALGYADLDVNAPDIKVFMMLSKLEQLSGLVDAARGGVVATSRLKLHTQAHMRWLRNRLTEE
jgi:hypothetical protein